MPILNKAKLKRPMCAVGDTLLFAMEDGKRKNHLFETSGLLSLENWIILNIDHYNLSKPLQVFLASEFLEMSATVGVPANAMHNLNSVCKMSKTVSTPL